MSHVEHADAGGVSDERVLRGDQGVVRRRLERAVGAFSRTRLAVQAALDQVQASRPAVISAATLRREREAVAATLTPVPFATLMPVPTAEPTGEPTSEPTAEPS